MEIYEDDKPPPSMDIASRCISAFGILCREILRYPYRVDAICLIHGVNLRRCNFNL